MGHPSVHISKLAAFTTQDHGRLPTDEHMQAGSPFVVSEVHVSTYSHRLSAVYVSKHSQQKLSRSRPLARRVHGSKHSQQILANDVGLLGPHRKHVHEHRMLTPVPVPVQAIHSRACLNLHDCDIQSICCRNRLVSTLFQMAIRTETQRSVPTMQKPKSKFGQKGRLHVRAS